VKKSEFVQIKNELVDMLNYHININNGLKYKVEM